MAHRPARLAALSNRALDASPAVAELADPPRQAKQHPRGRSVAVVAGAGVIVASAALTWLRVLSPSEPLVPPPQGTGHEQAVTLTPVATATRLTLVGTIGPGKTIAALAPFDGVIRERRAQLGALVDLGEVLVVMDASEIEGRLREAQATFLKASMAVDLLDQWATSPDVVRARRTQEAANVALSVIERQVVETKKLLDRGIVSRNEYDGLVQQRDTQRNGASGSWLDLQTTLERGSANNRRLADLELQNARSRLADLQAQADGSTVRAPVSGIVARPPVNAQSTPAPPTIEAGARVTRGQALFSIADTATLVVTARVDEVDVNRLRLGQPVAISGDAFPGPTIPGRIVGISAEADAGPASGRAPSFEVRSAFPGDANPQQDRIRIGMSARMQIELKSNPRSFIVPIEAVHDPLTNPTVQVRDPISGTVRPRNVTLGSTTEHGVEVLTGLEPGNIIIQPKH